MTIEKQLQFLKVISCDREGIMVDFRGQSVDLSVPNSDLQKNQFFQKLHRAGVRN